MATIHSVVSRWTNPISRFIADVEEAGGTMPAELSEIENLITATIQWTPPAAPAVPDLVASLTVKDAAASLDAFSTAPEPRDPRASVIEALAARWRKALGGASGDAVVESLSPIFAENLAEMQRLAELVPPEATTDLLSDCDDETLAAWRAIPAHRSRLDAIHQVVDALDAGGVLGGPEPHGPVDWHNTRKRYTLAAFYAADPARLEPARATISSAGAHLRRGGRWHGASGLVLNGPSRAREILAEAAWERKADHVGYVNTLHSDPHPDTAAVEAWLESQQQS